jgi:hypothetical protein
MTAFLALSQRAAIESGSVSTTGTPASVTGQTQLILIKIINWVIQAYNDIQNMHGEWLWLEGTKEFDTTANADCYAIASIFTASDRFAEYLIRDLEEVTMYLTATGVSDEGKIEHIPYWLWKQRYDRGTQTANRPIEWSISPANELCLGPKPDDAYTVRLPYRKGPQTLAANDDIPEMPARFHDMIWRGALMLGHGHLESQFLMAHHEGEYLKMLESLERDQLPRMEFKPEPLA